MAAVALEVREVGHALEVTVCPSGGGACGHETHPTYSYGLDLAPETCVREALLLVDGAAAAPVYEAGELLELVGKTAVEVQGIAEVREAARIAAAEAEAVGAEP